MHGPEHLRGSAWCDSGGGPDKSIWPASPSNGWVSGVARLWATPDGAPLEARDAWGHRGARAVYKGRRLPGRQRRHKLRARGDTLLLTRCPSGSVKRLRSFRSSAPWPWSSPESLASTLSPRYRSLFGNQPPDVCEGNGFPNVCRGGNVLPGGTTPARTLWGAFLGRRRTTCGPVAHHPP